MAIKEWILRLKNKKAIEMKDDTVLFLITLGSVNFDSDASKLESHSDAYHRLMNRLVAYVERHSKGETSPSDVRDEVNAILGDDTQVFVLKCDKFSAAWYMAEESCNWLKQHA